MSRLIATLGLGKYDVDAPIVDAEIKSRRLAIPLSQGIGAAAVATVAVGDTVAAGDEIGRFDPEKLGVAVHAPLGGRVLDVTEKSVVLGL
jgi:Na+-translocating ferredoxin:NAD+ oxidoreductase RnfC subunit